MDLVIKSNEVVESLNSNEILINVHDQEDAYVLQLKQVKHMIQLSHRYSSFYHAKARFWEKLFTRTTCFGSILAGAGVIISIVAPPCGTLNIVNGVLSAVIGGLLSSITGLNCPEKLLSYESAGDDFSAIGSELYREVFLTAKTLDRDELSHTIEKYSIKIEDLCKNNPQPPVDYKAPKDLIKITLISKDDEGNRRFSC